MKNVRLSIAILTMLTAAACSKSSDENNTPLLSQPKTYTEDIRSVAVNNVTTYNLTYDGNYRLVSMVAVPESLGKFIYQYPSSVTVTLDVYTGPDVSIHENFFLNNALYVDSTLQYNDTQDTTTEKYLYIQGNFLSKVNYYDYHTSGSTLTKTSNYVYDQFGNATTQTDNPGGVTTFTYYTVPNNFSLGNTFYPAPKNLLRSAASDNGVTAMHYYNFDSSGRIIQDSTVTTGIDVTVVKSYTY